MLMHDAMPPASLHRLDILDSIVDEHRLRGIKSESLLGLNIDTLVGLHYTGLERGNHVVTELMQRKAPFQFGPVQIAHVGQQENSMPCAQLL